MRISWRDALLRREVKLNSDKLVPLSSEFLVGTLTQTRTSTPSSEGLGQTGKDKMSRLFLLCFAMTQTSKHEVN